MKKDDSRGGEKETPIKAVYLWEEELRKKDCNREQNSGDVVNVYNGCYSCTRIFQDS